MALASNITVQRMLERDMFEKRVKEQRPIFLHEFMYPLMQGYDSVALEVDVELCGTDQIFNALVGRTLLKKYKNKDKFVVAVNLMENPRTGELMSKSRGTGVFLDSSPEDMYGAIMSQPDEMIRVFLVNNTRVPLDQVNEILSVDNPRDAKMRAAFEVTKVFHGEDHARSAQEGFVQQFQKREVPNEMPVVRMHATQSKAFDIVRQSMEQSTSNSDIRRLIGQGAVSFDESRVVSGDEVIEIPINGRLLKVGKRRWFKVMP